MFTKAFDLVEPYRRAVDAKGEAVWLPIVEVKVIGRFALPLPIPLLVDTGSDHVILKHEYYQLFDEVSWDKGEPKTVWTASGAATAYRFSGSIEVFGRRIEDLPIYLMTLFPEEEQQRDEAQRPFEGLLGREAFKAFGLGIWQQEQSLYISLSP